MSEVITSQLPPPPEPQPKPDDPRQLVLWYAFSQLHSSDPLPYWLDAFGQAPDSLTRAWCGVFGLWCLRQAGLTTWLWRLPSKAAPAGGFCSRLRMTEDPLPADVVYFDRPYQHHALLVKSEGDLLYLVQGNYGSPGRVASSVVSRSQKHPAFYSIQQLLKSSPQLLKGTS